MDNELMQCKLCQECNFEFKSDDCKSLRNSDKCPLHFGWISDKLKIKDVIFTGEYEPGFSPLEGPTERVIIKAEVTLSRYGNMGDDLKSDSDFGGVYLSCYNVREPGMFGYNFDETLKKTYGFKSYFNSSIVEAVLKLDKDHVYKTPNNDCDFDYGWEGIGVPFLLTDRSDRYFYDNLKYAFMHPDYGSRLIRFVKYEDGLVLNISPSVVDNVKELPVELSFLNSRPAVDIDLANAFIKEERKRIREERKKAKEREAKNKKK